MTIWMRCRSGPATRSLHSVTRTPVTLKELKIGLPENVKSRPRLVVCGVLITALLAACTSTSSSAPPRPRHSGEVVAGPDGTYVVPSGIHKIKHVIIVMQENRSFDSYFGTFPGADGIPTDGRRRCACPTRYAGAPGPTMTLPT